MRRRLVALSAVCSFLVLASSAFAAELFTKPTYKGDRLAWCKDWDSGCGKGAANAYCAYLGFGEAKDFDKDPNIGLKKRTRTIGSNQTCDKAYCDGFKFISCSKKEAPGPSPKTQAFDKPRWKGYRLDWCAAKGIGCGKGAADIFCSASGYAKAASFVPDLQVGNPTFMIGSGAICNTVVCAGFRTITCTK